MSLSYNDEEMLKFAEELANFENDPCLGAEGRWRGPISPFSIWEWAESRGRTELLPGIATAVASEVCVALYSRGGKDPKYENWITRLRTLTEDARRRNDLEAYAKYRRSQESFATIWNQGEIIDELISLYRKLGDRKWEIEYLYWKASGLMHLFLRKDAARIYLDIYQKSVEINYTKGICLSLLGFGEYLARGWRNRLAAICLYQAYSRGGTLWAITARDTLNNLRNDRFLNSRNYEKEIDLDILIDDVRKAIKI